MMFIFINLIFTNHFDEKKFSFGKMSLKIDN